MTRSPLFAALLALALPVAAQELHELDKGKGGHEPKTLPSGPSSGGKGGLIFIDEPTSHVEYRARPRAAVPAPALGKPVIDSAAALKRVVDSLASGKKVETGDLSWAKGVVAGELQRLADGDAELKFRAELSCAADAKKGLQCSAAEKHQQLLDAKKADYEKIKALLDGQ